MGRFINIKRVYFFVLTIFNVLLIILPNFLTVSLTTYATGLGEKESAEIRKKKEDGDERDFKSAIKDAGFGSDFKLEFEVAQKNGYVTEKEMVVDYIGYLILPGYYIEDINNYSDVVEDDVQVDSSVVKQKPNGRYTVCYHNNEPQNLLNHNCDVPTFGTELFNQIFKVYDKTGIQGSGTTSSYAGDLQLGVPVGIPGGKVPVNPFERTSKYTALELFGYDLEYTTYLGEYDDILTSSEARLLSNVGTWNKIKLGGAAILKGIVNIFNKYLGGWIFNPAKWGSKSPGFIDGVVSTVIDTSDYNLIANHAWKRPDFSNTLYNVHYLSDKAVIEKAEADFKKYIVDNLFDEIEKDPDAQEVLYLMPDGKYWPVFTFDPEMYTEESKSALARWESCMAAPDEVRVDYKGEEHTVPKSCGVKPTLVVVPEEEQFDRWKKTPRVVEYDARAKKQKIDCYDNAKLFPDVYACWEQPFDRFARKTLHHDNPVLQYALKAIERRFMKNNIYADPNRGISHYVCADEEGSPIGNSVASWQHYYTAENTREQEFVNPNCALVRPSIKGARFGTGDGISTDDRYLMYTANKSPASLGFFGGIARWLARFSSKITNTLLSLSYENIISYLQLDKIIETSINTFRDSIFFPLSVIFIAISGFYILFQSVQTGGKPWHTLLTLVMVYLLGVVLLFNSGKILSLVEEVPNKIDNVLLNAILQDDNKLSYCSGDGEDSEIRYMQCAVWDITIFTPWVKGQFGASYEDLADDRMKHTNRALVGTPDVNMGGGHIEQNWALWQLSKTKSGTITEVDPKKITGYQSKALYKLVDLQAGPNHSQGRDTRFFNAWSGVDSNRSGIMLYSGIIGVVLLIIIGGLCIAKIEMTFLLLFKIAFFPAILAKALLPNGNVKLMEYFSDVLGIFIKRIFIIILLAITLNVCIAIGHSDIQYEKIGLFIIAFLIAILIYWKSLFNIISKSKAQVGQIKNKFKNTSKKYIPADLQYYFNRTRSKAKSIVPGALGGAIGALSASSTTTTGEPQNSSSIIQDALRGARYGAAQLTDRNAGATYKQQRRLGFGVLKQFADAKRAGSNMSLKGLLLKPTNQQRYDVKQVYNVLVNQEREYAIELNKLEHEANNLVGPRKIESIEREGIVKDRLNKIRLAKTNVEKVTNNANWKTTEKWESSGNSDVDKAILSVRLGRKVTLPNVAETIASPIVKNGVFDEMDEFKKDEDYKDNFFERTITVQEEADLLVDKINNALSNNKQKEENND